MVGPIDTEIPAAEQNSLRLIKQYAQLKIANSYFLEKNYPAARKEYEAGIRLEAVHAQFKADAEEQLYMMAAQEIEAGRTTAVRKKVEAGEYGAARKDLERALTLAVTPADKVYALMLIAESYRLEDNHQQARAAWSQIADVNDADEETRMRIRWFMGSSYLNDNKPEEARAEFLKVTQDKQFDKMSAMEKATIFFMISRTYSYEKKYEQARTELSKIPVILSNKHTPSLPLPYRLTLRPASPSRPAFQLTIQSPAALLLILSVDYGDTYLEQGNFDQARIEYKKVTTTNIPAEIPAEEQNSLRLIKQYAQFKIANSYFLEKNYPAARREYQKVIRMEAVHADFKADAEEQLRLIAAKESSPF